MDLSLLAVTILFATVLLRIALVGGAAWLLIRRRVTCPHCAEPVLPLVTPRPLTALGLERRWCYECGWSGISKRVERQAVPPVVKVPEVHVEHDEGWRPPNEGWSPDQDGPWA